VNKLKIAIAGAGVAGSYLGCLLKSIGHDVNIFEASKEENHWPVCAWGASYHMLSRFSAKAGLNFDNYVLHIGKVLKMDLPNNVTEYLDLRGLVTYDKRRWEQDMLAGARIEYGTQCVRGTFPSFKFDLVIDCTGFHRTLLPKSDEDFIIPAYEYLVENVDPLEEFYVIGYKGARGYFWCFPLDKEKAYIGAGDIDRRYYGIQDFFQKNPKSKIVKKIGRPIRLSPPRRMEPFTSGNIVGVGESIGCVFPMLGEGIIPSLLCCDLFIETLEDRRTPNFDEYRKKVLRKFSYYDDVYRIVRLKMDNKLNMVRHLNLIMSMYINMKKEEKRFGFEINFSKMKRLVSAL
jgi:flavin-dependent dehydrogenase